MGVLPHYTGHPGGYIVSEARERLLRVQRVWEREDAGREGLRPCGNETPSKSADHRYSRGRSKGKPRLLTKSGWGLIKGGGGTRLWFIRKEGTGERRAGSRLRGGRSRGRMKGRQAFWGSAGEM